jgi:hypothetical protein
LARLRRTSATATPIAISTGNQNLAVPMITRNQIGSARSGRSISGSPMSGHGMDGHGMDGPVDVGEPGGDPVQYRLQQEAYEQSKAEQRCGDLSDCEHYVAGRVKPRMLPLPSQEPGSERPARRCEWVAPRGCQNAESIGTLSHFTIIRPSARFINPPPLAEQRSRA